MLLAQGFLDVRSFLLNLLLKFDVLFLEVQEFQAVALTQLLVVAVDT